jgi:hypothetical protein
MPAAVETRNQTGTTGTSDTSASPVASALKHLGNKRADGSTEVPTLHAQVFITFRKGTSMQSSSALLRRPSRLARALVLAGTGVVLAVGTSSASAACPAPATTATNGKCQVKFLADGTFTVPSGVTTVDLLIVGGGAGGGGVSAGGGATGAGGAGGQARTIMGTAVTQGAEIPVSVGAGGAGGTTGAGTDGIVSVFGSPLDPNSILTRAFGGYAGLNTGSSSRGGQTLANALGYTTIPGGDGDLQGSGGGGGSGGAGGKGGAVTGGAGTGVGGSGGIGVDAATDFALSGSTIFGAGGGGAGTTTGGQSGAAIAGNGGSGASPAGQSATANFGGGGGGGNGTIAGGSGGAGGSGVVLVQFTDPPVVPSAIATAVGSTTTKRLPNGRFQTSLTLTLTSAGNYSLSTRDKRGHALALLASSKLGTTTLRRGAYTISYTSKTANQRVTYSAVTLRRPPAGSTIKVVLPVSGKGKTVSFPIK